MQLKVLERLVTVFCARRSSLKPAVSYTFSVPHVAGSWKVDPIRRWPLKLPFLPDKESDAGFETGGPGTCGTILRPQVREDSLTGLGRCIVLEHLSE